MKKLSTEEFIKKASVVHNGKYDYKETVYNGNRKKVKIICPKHGLFFQTAKNHINGEGCPECAKENASVINKKSEDRFKNDVINKYGNKFDLSEAEYINSKEKVKVRCNNCGKVFFIRPNDLLTKGHICKNERAIKRYNGKEIIEESNKIHGDKYSYMLDLDKNYLRKDVISIICPEHGLFKQTIGAHLNGNGCRLCGIKNFREARKISSESIRERIKKVCPENIHFSMDNYENTNSLIKFKCDTCGYEFERKASSFVSNPTCPNCVKKQISLEKKKTTEEFIEESKLRYGDNVFDYSKTKYISSSDKVTLICKECGREFQIEANSHLQGHGCPYHFCNRSKMEDDLFKWFIENIDEDAISNYKFPNSGFEIDIFSKKYSFGIEFDGLYWHNELNKDKNYHLLKTESCKNEGIRLFHIFEDEWIGKSDILKSMISTICGKFNKKIYARKCDLVNVSSHEAMLFLNENHLQGACGSSIRYGLRYNGNLVSLMTFGKSRHFVGSGKIQYELLRFVNKKNTIVVGGASKLFKKFIKEYSPESIVSYADKRWSVGNLYDKLGFQKYNESKPNYYYVINNKRVYRFNLRKEILIKKYGCKPDMTEREFCKNMKWWRIYDCGCLCFIWKSEK